MWIEITGLNVSEINKLGDQIKGNWHNEAIGGKNFIRIEDVIEVI